MHRKRVIRTRKTRSKVKSRGQSERYVLDEFSRASLQQWKKHASALDKYHVQLFYHLEGLRKTHKNALIEALRQSSIQTVQKSDWSRLVSFRYSDDFLSPRGSLIGGGRFNIGTQLDARVFPGFPALYLAEDNTTAYAEYFGAPETSSPGQLSGHEFALQKKGSYSNVQLSFKVENIFDLTKANNLTAFAKVIAKFKVPPDLKLLGHDIGFPPSSMLIRTPSLLRKDLIAANWRNYPVQYEIPANSQIFGRILRDAGFEGVIYPSSKGTGKCIAIFVENFEGSDSYIELVDEAPVSVRFTRLEASNWKELSRLDI